MQIRRRKIRALGATGSEKKQVCWEEEKRPGGRVGGFGDDQFML